MTWGLSLQQVAQGLWVYDSKYQRLMTSKIRADPEIKVQLTHEMACSPENWLDLEGSDDLLEAYQQLDLLSLAPMEPMKA